MLGPERRLRESAGEGRGAGNSALRCRLAKLPFPQADDRCGHRRLERVRRGLWFAGGRRRHRAAGRAGSGGGSECDEGFGSPGVSAVIERLAGRVIGQPVFDHERIYTELYCLTRPAAGGVVAEGLGAIENALLDAKAKAPGLPCHALLGGKLRDRIRVYWSHCATWRINHPLKRLSSAFASIGKAAEFLEFRHLS